ncbi:hypothetical protein HRI_002968600 [Hibiscus trionum]|uniref:Uncharacterized protein n=1 Tax=Hibiscus trionum TaxID=183268 RepID=A0A9W7MA37_HIBTR|nr:hypothetical protein HRI_002966500 [Hibiscus trionum]GMI92991.1 hypothetical protein HRI_002968400 [Hibiscus trionum]GMI92994.1 hypothetical protein HRI_002968600 [Hibiscus trionum]
MASHTIGLIQDRNVNVRFNGKANVSKAPRKAGTGGRKPLGDVSNSVKPTPNQIPKKENAKIIPFTGKEIGALKLTHDSTKKKSVSKASDKVQATGRKALSDISNSGKPYSQGTSKTNQTAKLSILEVHRHQPEDIAEEGYLHNHEGCIKAQKRAISTNEFLRTLGLDDFSKHSASAKEYSLSKEMEPMSPPRYAEPNKMTAMLIEELSPPKHKSSRILDSFAASPEQLDHHMQWDDPTYIPSFKLIESP